MHAVADEDGGRGEFGAVLSGSWCGEKIFQRFEIFGRGVTRLDREARRRIIARFLEQVHRLIERAVGARGLQAVGTELCRDVGGGEIVAAGAGGAAFHEIVSEERRVCAHGAGRGGFVGAETEREDKRRQDQTAGRPAAKEGHLAIQPTGRACRKPNGGR